MMKCISYHIISYIIYLLLGLANIEEADKEECTILWYRQQKQQQQQRGRRSNSVIPHKSEYKSKPKIKKISSKPKSQWMDHPTSSIVLEFIKDTFFSKAKNPSQDPIS